jgi:hypothetical protein
MRQIPPSRADTIRRRLGQPEADTVDAVETGAEEYDMAFQLNKRGTVVH